MLDLQEIASGPNFTTIFTVKVARARGSSKRNLSISVKLIKFELLWDLNAGALLVPILLT